MGRDFLWGCFIIPFHGVKAPERTSKASAAYRLRGASRLTTLGSYPLLCAGCRCDSTGKTHLPTTTTTNRNSAKSSESSRSGLEHLMHMIVRCSTCTMLWSHVTENCGGVEAAVSASVEDTDRHNIAAGESGGVAADAA